MLPWIVIVVLVAGCVWLAWTLQRTHKQKAALETRQGEVAEELKRLQATQSQVIHTTKLASLGQMVAGVAHEINTPLGFVKSNVEVVGDLLDDYRNLVVEYDAAVQYCLQPVDLIFGADKASLDKLVKHVEEARRKLFEARTRVETSSLLTDAKELLTDAGEGLGQLSSLVLNLKGFSRVDRDGMDNMDLNEGIESALMIAQHQMRDRVKVIKQLEPLPKVRCMASQMNQVFLNLITNAAQAIEGNGTLTITSKPVGKSVEISFTDTGCGIPDEVLPNIFDPFFTTKPVGEGTGLGLSIVHKIVKSHGGSIKVRTTPGKGTQFLVTLPADGAVVAANPVAAASAA
ncbi:MAG TPA: ATP-binding protein [Rudaea sp.]|nr:ATP-binding protein [Rudaea sp.]